MSDSTAKAPSRKSNRPPKPYKDFPLSPHASGAWQKKINGRIYYFGRWGRQVKGKLVRLPGDGWKDALDLFQAQRDDLYAGRTPRKKRAGSLQLGDLCNEFFWAKKRKFEAGEITKPTFVRYRNTTDLLIAQFGRERQVDDLASDDFAQLRATMAGRWGPFRLSTEIVNVKSIFKFGYESGLIKTVVRYGPEFVRPSASTLRKHKAKNGKKMFTAEECRKLLDVAPVPLRAMVLLALNAGFGNQDCATLPMEAVDLDSGFVDYARPKTGVERRCSLWPETVAALKEVIEQRPEPNEQAAEGLVFVTPRGKTFITGGIANPISVRIRDLMKKAVIHRKGLGLYTLRHVFRTVADGCRDQPAINHVMGHTDVSMAAQYREGIEDERLQAVANYVRAWLFGEGGQTDAR